MPCYRYAVIYDIALIILSEQPIHLSWTKPWKHQIKQPVKHFVPHTLFAYILYSSNQFFLEILALLSNLISFFQKVLSGLLYWSSQNVSLLRAPFLFARWSFIACVNKRCYLWERKPSFFSIWTILQLLTSQYIAT